MSEEQTKTTFYGFIPPPHYNFSSGEEAVGFMIASLCSQECARFLKFIAEHPKKNTTVGRFLPAYTLINWSEGNIDQVVWYGRERGAKESLIRWANSMIELNTWFKDQGIEDPIRFITKERLIKPSKRGFGWEPNPIKLQEFLKIELG